MRLTGFVCTELRTGQENLNNSEKFTDYLILCKTNQTKIFKIKCGINFLCADEKQKGKWVFWDLMPMLIK